MPLVLEVVLDGCNIMDLVYRGGRAGEGWGGGRWGAVGGLKQTFKHKWHCCAIST